MVAKAKQQKQSQCGISKQVKVFQRFLPYVSFITWNQMISQMITIDTASPPNG